MSPLEVQQRNHRKAWSFLKTKLSPIAFDEFKRLVGEQMPRLGYDEAKPVFNADTLGFLVELSKRLTPAQTRALVALFLTCGSSPKVDELAETLSADEPPPFSGRPNPGGKVDPLDKLAAMDAQSVTSFDRMFPEASRLVR